MEHGGLPIYSAHSSNSSATSWATDDANMPNMFPESPIDKFAKGQIDLLRQRIQRRCEEKEKDAVETTTRVKSRIRFRLRQLVSWRELKKLLKKLKARYVHKGKGEGHRLNALKPISNIASLIGTIIYRVCSKHMPSLNSSTGLTITNPLILYRSLLATKKIEPDPAQHRLALHLQKLYYRLKDYQPGVDFHDRLIQLHNLVQHPPPIPQAEARGTSNGLFSTLRGQRKEAEATAVTRRLTSHESAIQLESPQGLMLYGEVGTGKSLLVDLLADCLPNRKKRRWHFNTFMLETFAKLEHSRRNRSSSALHMTVGGSSDEEHSLLSIARDMITTSPILFLDEFQLPDRAATKILSNLLVSFFHLGGVLIATSNRMPEELAKASGVEFTAPPSSRFGFLGNRWGLLGSQIYGGKTSGKGDLAAFLEVLRARCEIWDMECTKDWRRREVEGEIPSETMKERSETDMQLEGAALGLEPLSAGNLGLGYEQSLHVRLQGDENDKAEASPTKVQAPKFYFVNPSATPMAFGFKIAEIRAIHHPLTEVTSDVDVQWTAMKLQVYGRSLAVLRSHSGVTKYTFPELCETNLGPADYATIASTFHTLILTDIPILTHLQKNEARRFITLLDALYESRCKLLISAEAGPDDIFFPETQSLSTDADKKRLVGDEVYPETFSEIYQDRTSPFRPNISSYTSSASPPSYAPDPIPLSPSQANVARSILADEDSDFGPVYGAGRNRGASDAVPGAGNEIGRQTVLDFSRTGSYTGEDEKFAYKRARSRLWEMCSSRWWGREEEGWWRPLPKEVRRWEGHVSEPSRSSDESKDVGSIEGERNKESLFRHGASPFRTSQEPPPKFGFQHAWGMMQWGKKAGAWGKGPRGLNERNKDKGND